MRNVIAFVVALGIVAAIFWFTRSRENDAKPPPAVASGSVTQPSGSPAKIDTTKVRRLDKATRKQLGEQIAAARDRARASRAGGGDGQGNGGGGTPPAALPDDVVMKLEDVSSDLQDQLRATIPILAECYGNDKREALAQMVLTSDPELGTVIDTQRIMDAGGEPLNTKLDECLRDTIDSLALPPLGDKGGTLPLQYTFRFD